MRNTLIAIVFTILAAASCSDVSRLNISLRFPDADTDEATRQLLFVVREPGPGDPCDALWGPQPAGLAEFSRLLDYPNRNDVVAAPLDVGLYTLLVYSYTSELDLLCDEDLDCEDSEVGTMCREIGAGKKACVSDDAGLVPLVGGCAEGRIDANGASELTVTLDTRTASVAGS